MNEISKLKSIKLKGSLKIEIWIKSADKSNHFNYHNTES